MNSENFKYDQKAHDQGFEGVPPKNPYDKDTQWDLWASYQLGEEDSTAYHND